MKGNDSIFCFIFFRSASSLVNYHLTGLTFYLSICNLELYSRIGLCRFKINFNFAKCWMRKKKISLLINFFINFEDLLREIAIIDKNFVKEFVTIVRFVVVVIVIYMVIRIGNLIKHFIDLFLAFKHFKIFLLHLMAIFSRGQIHHTRSYNYLVLMSSI